MRRLHCVRRVDTFFRGIPWPKAERSLTRTLRLPSPKERSMVIDKNKAIVGISMEILICRKRNAQQK